MTYTYICNTCLFTFDVVQKMADDPLVECPQCGDPIRKVIQVPTIKFIGEWPDCNRHKKVGHHD